MIKTPAETGLHEQVHLLYVREGDADLRINGCTYPLRPGALFCLYPHHLYGVGAVRRPVHVVQVGFYIGLFMYMSWEKHPKNANAALVYDTSPVVLLAGRQREQIETLVQDILAEYRGDRFEHGNLIAYKTLELHTYFCRFAYEQIGRSPRLGSTPWNEIEKLLLCTEKKLPLEQMAERAGCRPATLNARIKAACGLTAPQLHQLGRVWNARALLRFSQLSLAYIAELNGFETVQDFTRVFSRWCGIAPGEYRADCGRTGAMAPAGAEVGMQILQYLHSHFSDPLTDAGIAAALCMRPATVAHTVRQIFGQTTAQLACGVRVRYACTLLAATDSRVEDIAEHCGFPSYPTFRRAFLDQMGEPPAQYRKTQKMINKQV